MTVSNSQLLAEIRGSIELTREQIVWICNSMGKADSKENPMRITSIDITCFVMVAMLLGMLVGLKVL